MIPKIIHYCWFGGSGKPDVVKKCFDTWQSVLNDYEFVLWNESNFNIDSAPQFVKDAFSEKKWAFVADYVRLYALFQYGGICLDTDVEVKKSLNDFLEADLFIGTQNFPIDIDKNTKARKIYLSMGVIGSIPDHPYIKDCLVCLSSSQFSLQHLTATNNLMTSVLTNYGYDAVDEKQMLQSNIVVYPSNFFADKLKPEDYDSCHTYHWGEMSWYVHKERGFFWKFCNRLNITKLYGIIESSRLKLFPG